MLAEDLKEDPDLDHIAQKKEYFRPDSIENNFQNRMMMHIITPAFPHMNSTFSISEAQLEIIYESFQEAFKITRLISLNELSWDDLLLEYPFFHDFDFFLEIEILS